MSSVDNPRAAPLYSIKDDELSSVASEEDEELMDFENEKARRNMIVQLVSAAVLLFLVGFAVGFFIHMHKGAGAVADETTPLITSTTAVFGGDTGKRSSMLQLQLPEELTPDSTEPGTPSFGEATPLSETLSYTMSSSSLPATPPNTLASTMMTSASEEEDLEGDAEEAEIFSDDVLNTIHSLARQTPTMTDLGGQDTSVDDKTSIEPLNTLTSEDEATLSTLTSTTAPGEKKDPRKIVVQEVIKKRFTELTAGGMAPNDAAVMAIKEMTAKIRAGLPLERVPDEEVKKEEEEVADEDEEDQFVKNQREALKRLKEEIDGMRAKGIVAPNKGEETRESSLLPLHQRVKLLQEQNPSMTSNEALKEVMREMGREPLSDPFENAVIPEPEETRETVMPLHERVQLMKQQHPSMTSNDALKTIMRETGREPLSDPFEDAFVPEPEETQETVLPLYERVRLLQEENPTMTKNEALKAIMRETGREPLSDPFEGATIPEPEEKLRMPLYERVKLLQEQNPSMTNNAALKAIMREMGREPLSDPFEGATLPEPEEEKRETVMPLHERVQLLLVQNPTMTKNEALKAIMRENGREPLSDWFEGAFVPEDEATEAARQGGVKVDDAVEVFEYPKSTETAVYEGTPRERSFSMPAEEDEFRFGEFIPPVEKERAVSFAEEPAEVITYEDKDAGRASSFMIGSPNVPRAESKSELARYKIKVRPIEKGTVSLKDEVENNSAEALANMNNSSGFLKMPPPPLTHVGEAPQEGSVLKLETLREPLLGLPVNRDPELNVSSSDDYDDAPLLGRAISNGLQKIPLYAQQLGKHASTAATQLNKGAGFLVDNLGRRVTRLQKYLENLDLDDLSASTDDSSEEQPPPTKGNDWYEQQHYNVVRTAKDSEAARVNWQEEQDEQPDGWLASQDSESSYGSELAEDLRDFQFSQAMKGIPDAAAKMKEKARSRKFNEVMQEIPDAARKFNERKIIKQIPEAARKMQFGRVMRDIPAVAERMRREREEKYGGDVEAGLDKAFEKRRVSETDRPLKFTDEEWEQLARVSSAPSDETMKLSSTTRQFDPVLVTPDLDGVDDDLLVNAEYQNNINNRSAIGAVDNKSMVNSSRLRTAQIPFDDYEAQEEMFRLMNDPENMGEGLRRRRGYAYNGGNSLWELS